ncbi:MAG: hypothetical protein ACI9KE_000017 [Polyangiales bacterium]|jgi:hypothetical protein
MSFTKCLTLLSLILAMACGDDATLPIADVGSFDAGPSGSDGGPDLVDGGTDAGPSGIRGGALTFTPIYQAPEANDRNAGEMRPWIPVDLDEGTDGDLWVIHRMDREEFSDAEECTERGASTRPSDDDNCFGLQGGTAAIADPAADSMATIANNRVNFVVDQNALHFMRRPSAIAFGMAEDTLEPGDPGTLDRDGSPLITETQIIPHIFGTCAEHATGNLTDGQPFIGPSLWTGDRDIYSNGNMPYPWSNGSHLDMVHGTQYCMGMAWEQDQVFWVLNGSVGSIDRYDFGKPHSPGHFYHEDASVTRYLPPQDALGRVVDVPSNLEIDGDTLFIADTFNTRVVTLSLTEDIAPTRTFRTYEDIEGDIILDPTLTELVTAEQLTAEWGADARPSGLATVDAETLVIADHTSGMISVIDRASGEIVRTVDTGLGGGIGGMTAMQGSLYFAHMTTRQVYRIDIAD